MRSRYTDNAAFTMLEMVFAIVVMGILASLAIPRIERDLVSEAAENILSDIRYTQHLALMDNKHMFNSPNWQRKWWRIGFQQCSGGGWFETISSDLDMQGDIDQGEEALDPVNGLPMDVPGNNCNANGLDPRILLTRRYGITNVISTCDPSNRYIGFDYLGRPHTGYLGSNQPNYNSYITNSCSLTFVMSTDSDGDGMNDTFMIIITPETGHAFINGRPDS